MRILLISGEYPPMISGIGDYTHLLSKSLAELGHEVCVLTGLNEDTAFQDGSIKVLRQVSHWDSSLWPCLQHLVEDWQPDIVHIQFHTCSFERKWFIHLLPWRLRARFPRLRIFTTFHEFAAPLLKFANIPMFLASHGNIVTNDRDFDRLKKIIPSALFHKKVTYHPLCANVPLVNMTEDQKEKIRTELQVKGKDSLIVRFGLIHQQALTQISTIMSACKTLKQEGMNLKLLLIGKKAEGIDQSLENELKTHGLADDVRFVDGESPEKVSQYLQSSDIAVAPYADGISERRGAFLSALVHGLPVVTYRKGHFPNKLKHKENVYVIDSNESEEWSSAIRDLIKDGIVRDEISEAAKQMQVVYNPHSVAQATAFYYQKALG